MRSRKQLLQFELCEQVLQLLALEREWEVRKAQIGAAAEGRLDRFEDAAWEYARLEEGMMRSQVIELESDLRNSYVIEINECLEPNTVQIGTRVLLKNLTEDIKEIFLVSGTSGEGRVSTYTQLAKALAGAKAGQEVKFEAHDLSIEYKVLEISWGVKAYLEDYLPGYLDQEIPTLEEVRSNGFLDPHGFQDFRRDSNAWVESLRKRAHLSNIANKLEYALSMAEQHGINLQGKERYHSILEALRAFFSQVGISHTSLSENTYLTYLEKRHQSNPRLKQN